MIKRFLDWCKANNISGSKNVDVFFINERFSLRPNFKLSTGLYVVLATDKEMNDDFLSNCEQFGKSYGTVMVIPKEIINDLGNFTKQDLERKFEISL